MTDQIQVQDDILQQLEEKDQLIQTLTERLGEVAEQLDRAQRSGERGSRSGGAAGVSNEMLEQQRQLLESLANRLEGWDDVQPRNAFGRIEARLDHMRSLLESALESGFAPGAAFAAEDDSFDERDESRSDAKTAEEEKEKALSGWEAMKAQLLVGGTAKPQAAPESSIGDDGATSAEETAGAAVEPSRSEGPAGVGEDFELPQPVDFETAERADLEQAINVRDEFIGVLMRRLRSEQHRTRQAIDWGAINNAPDELRERLQSLEADLQDRLRIAEVELSLERARLSRVQSHVEDMQRQFEERVKSSRKQGPANMTAELRAAANGESADSKKWFNSLRRK